MDEGEYDKATSHYRESLPLFRQLDDLTGVACALAELGNVTWLQGDREQALRRHQESLASFKDPREGSTIAFCLECQAGGVRPAPGGLQRLVERHNERLDLPPEGLVQGSHCRSRSTFGDGSLIVNPHMKNL